MAIEVWQARLARKQLLTQLRAEYEGNL